MTKKLTSKQLEKLATELTGLAPEPKMNKIYKTDRKIHATQSKGQPLKLTRKEG